MVVLLPVAALIFLDVPEGSGGGQAETAGVPTAAPVRPATNQKPGSAAVPDCPQRSTDSQTIVICTERPQGYRLNPDVMEAKRETKNSSRPVRPGGRVIPDCTNVGPAPCTSAGINLIGAALTAAQIAERLAKGQEVGSMFVTDPRPSEYQLYQMAKERREAEQAQKAADDTQKAAEAKAEALKKAKQADPQGATDLQPKPPGQ